MNKTLITGITGQDGIYLTSKLLQQKDNYIYGTTRNKNINNFIENLKSLGATNFSNLQVIQEDLLDQRKIEKLFLNLQPSTVYNFTGPSSVYESLIDNGDSQKQIVEIFDNLISASMKLDNLPNFFQPSSSEMFGPGDYNVLNEDSPFNPISPYAEAKLKNHLRVIELAKNYDWNIKSGIMFNHESEFRKDNYLFSKVIKSVIEIENGTRESLTVGSLEYERDWSFAGDIVDATYLIINNAKLPAYVIGSGTSKKIKDLIQLTFDYFELDWEKYVEVDESLLRINDPVSITSDPTLLKSELKWNPKFTFEDLIKSCIEGMIKNK
tara:strand:- start:12052 stop:13023 length:972 start_codon:yes stop_codon:yes gene_type:complete